MLRGLALMLPIGRTAALLECVDVFGMHEVRLFGLPVAGPFICLFIAACRDRPWPDRRDRTRNGGVMHRAGDSCRVPRARRWRRHQPERRSPREPTYRP